MIILLLLVRALGVEYGMETKTAEIKGAVGRFRSSYQRFEVPKKNIVKLEISISLDDFSPRLEYPICKPMAYIGRDINPESYYDYSLNLSHETSLSLDRFPHTSFLIFRIDGGLNFNFSLTPSYDVSDANYTITLQYSYCASDFYSSSDLTNCDVLMISNHENPNYYFSSVIEIPKLIHYITISEYHDYLTVSKENFGNAYTHTGVGSFTFTLVGGGKYFVTGYGYLEYLVVKCTLVCDNFHLCGEQLVEDLGRIDVNATELVGRSASVLVFDVTPEDIKYSYNIDIEPSNIGYTHYYTQQGIDGITPYLRAGRNFISVDSSEYSTRIYRIMPTSANFCNDHGTVMENEIVFYCKCHQHYSGRHCELEGIPANEYLLGLFLLAASNLSMLPTIIIGSLYGYYAEVIIFTANMIASIFYHICDYNYYCFNLDYPFLHDTDFTLSYFSVLITVVYLAKIQQKELKLVIYCALFIHLFIIGKNKSFSNVYIEILVIHKQPPIIIGIIPIIRYLTIVVKLSLDKKGSFWSWQEFWWFFVRSGNFRWKWVLLAITGLSLSLGLRYAYDNNRNYYLVLPI